MEKPKGWKWETKNGFLFVGVKGRCYIFHAEVGPVALVIEYPRKYWEGYQKYRRR